MREIKFRVWDTKSKNWIQNDVVIRLNGRIVEVSYGELMGEETGCILQQYTGLKDKNDREIYEGDIIICHPDSQEKCIVDWSPDGIWWATDLIQPPERELYGQELYMYPKCQVIGNILENPDLLK